MTLREKIEEILVKDKPEDVAKNICLMLEEEMCLSGNGWFDDDEILTQIIIEKEL